MAKTSSNGGTATVERPAPPKELLKLIPVLGKQFTALMTTVGQIDALTDRVGIAKELARSLGALRTRGGEFREQLVQIANLCIKHGIPGWEALGVAASAAGQASNGGG